MTNNPQPRDDNAVDNNQVGTAETINQLADTLFQTLSADALYPVLPEELSFAFLKGIDPKALSPEERDGLRLEQAADQRLTSLLDQLVNAIESRKAKLLLKGESMFSLLPKPGIKSFTEQRSRDSGKSFGKAARELAAAKTLEKVTSAQTALDDGAISTGHVEVLARALETNKRNGAKELTSDEQAYVTGLATGRTESDYGTLLAQFLAGRNPLAADSELEEARRRRFFNISYTPHGAYFKGFVDKVAAQALRQALDAASDRPGADDDRSLTQRSADALVNLATAALDAGKLKSGANVRPHVTLIMTEDTFAQTTKELARRKSLAKAQTQIRKTLQGECTTPLVAESDPDNTLASDMIADTDSDSVLDSDSKQPLARTHEIDPTGLLNPALLEPISVEPAEYLDGTPVPLTELERILCDCEITRTVIQSDGLVTNLGRTTRLYTKEHRHAIIARDRTCRFSGCTTLPNRCEIHHIDWWERDNGETSIENAVFVCKRHHTEIHEGTLKVVKTQYGLPTIVVAEPVHSSAHGQSSFGAVPPPTVLPPRAELSPGTELPTRAEPLQPRQPVQKPLSQLSPTLQRPVRHTKDSLRRRKNPPLARSAQKPLSLFDS